MGEALNMRFVWGSRQAVTIARDQDAALRKAGLYDSYEATLRRMNTVRAEIDKEFANTRFRPLGQIAIEEKLQLPYPLLPIALDREGMPTYGTIPQLSLAKVNPETGGIITSTMLGPIAVGYDRTFTVVNENFRDEQIPLLYDKIDELRSHSLYVHLPFD